MYDPAWMLTETVNVARVETMEPGEMRVLVRSLTDKAGSYRECELRWDQGELWFNNVYVDVDDDFMAYLGLMEEVSETGPGVWVRSEPDEEETDAI